MARRTKAAPKLLNHRTVAAMFDIDPETLRKWVAKGEFPEPVATVSQTWFYPAAAVSQFIAEGRWPEGTRFKNAPAPLPN